MFQIMSLDSWTLYKLCINLKVDQGCVIMLYNKELDYSHEKMQHENTNVSD